MILLPSVALGKQMKYLHILVLLVQTTIFARGWCHVACLCDTVKDDELPPLSKFVGSVKND